MQEQPEPKERDAPMQTAVLVALSFIMFSLGTTLRGSDFASALADRRALALGLCCQLVLLPALAFGVSVLAQLPPLLAVGVVLIACCPAGTTSSYLSYLAGGDLALSVVLTVVSGLASVMTLPLYLWLAAHWFSGPDGTVQVDLAEAVKGVILLTLIPMLSGMVLRQQAPAIMQRLSRPIRLAAGGLFAFVVVVMWTTEWRLIATSAALVGLATMALNFATLACSELAGRSIGLSAARRTTVVLEAGIRNVAFAVGIALYVLEQPALAVPASVYSVTMILTGLAVVWLRRRLAAQWLPG